MTSEVEVQVIHEVVNLYVVEDYVIQNPVLLDHSFTERPGIVITKTSNELIFQRFSSEKFHLKVGKQINLVHNIFSPVPVESSSIVTGIISVNGSLRGREGREYYLFPGEYDINHGRSIVLVLNVSSKNVTIDKGY